MRRLIAMLLVLSALVLPLSASLVDLPLAAFSSFENAPIEIRYPHYLDENSPRYEAFQALNPNIAFDRVIAYVNASVDVGFYIDITTVDNPESISVLLNKNFALPDGYEPPDLLDIGWSRFMRSEAAGHFLQMREDMVSAGMRLNVITSYRTFAQQARRFNSAVVDYGRASAERQFARPGHSEHQSGLAVDFLHVSMPERMTHARFENSREYAWLQENAHRYGFILRYPRGYGDIHGFIFEPWHWRYVGVGIATRMYTDGITTLEEYYGRFLAPEVHARWENEAMKWLLASGICLD